MKCASPREKVEVGAACMIDLHISTPQNKRENKKGKKTIINPSIKNKSAMLPHAHKPLGGKTEREEKRDFGCSTHNPATRDSL
jgi:hypothetical protein